GLFLRQALAFLFLFFLFRLLDGDVRGLFHGLGGRLGLRWGFGFWLRLWFGFRLRFGPGRWGRRLHRLGRGLLGH
ncbi:MAG TPA: hypothetical protein DCM06_01930, partial [Comamonadaceae bacterium]|nr:hypothetical protein [Comamonadaceae bacterium]